MEEMKAGFALIGIEVRTTNHEQQAMYDLGQLWGRFFSEQVAAKIPEPESNDIIAVYTDYESDYTGYYTAIIGMKVKGLDHIPEGFTGREFPAGRFRTFIAKGPMPDAVASTWNTIWQQDKELARAYTYDYEVYGAKSQNGDQSEVEVYIAI